MSDNLPAHVAIIPDGNRRWAEIKGVSQIEGHRAGAQRMHQAVEGLLHHGVKFLTVWGFSTDNWKREPAEVESIFNLLLLWIQTDTPWSLQNGVRLRHIGRLHELPPDLQDAINEAMQLTKHNSTMTLNVAFNYTGRAEIVDAVRWIVANEVGPWAVDEQMVASHLYANDIPDVDLVIRTADEFRISNFMLWQTAYSEFYFTPVFWPDFDSMELEKALAAYRQRDRRFGGG